MLNTQRVRGINEINEKCLTGSCYFWETNISDDIIYIIYIYIYIYIYYMYIYIIYISYMYIYNIYIYIIYI